MPIRVGMVSLGCSKNQVDAERMLYKINEKGYELVGDAALADVAIINTCGFIESAKQEAIETILEFAELKKEGRIKKIIITGCLAERYKDEVASEIPEADAVVGIGCNDKICDVIEKVLEGDHFTAFDSKLNLGLTGGRIQTTLSFYSYLKIADGCSNCCSFCAIPSIRGRNRSVPMEQLFAEATELAVNGVRELILIAQDSTRYGEDIYGNMDVNQLRKKVGMVFQKPNPFPMSIYDNIAYGPRTHGVRRKDELDEIVERSLRGAAIWDEVKDRLKKSALGLSGGQQQRLCIARALAVQPQVLLMDEPTSALDPISTSKIEELATNLKEQYTIIIVTHNMQQALRISDKTAFFLLGELIEYDDTQKLFYQPKQKRTEDYITGRFG